MIEIRSLDSKLLRTVDAPSLAGVNLCDASLRNANLHNIDLRRVSLCGANLCGADLSNANLRCSNLYDSDLCDSDLRNSDLSNSDLRNSDLRNSNLRNSNLRNSDLCDSDLRNSDLSNSDLRGADLHGTKVKGVRWPSPTMVLLAYWGHVSEDLTRDLMAFDAWCHPDPEAFDRWAADGNGPCPYNNVDVQRATYFCQSKNLWTAETKTPQSPLVLMRRLLDECCDVS